MELSCLASLTAHWKSSDPSPSQRWPWKLEGDDCASRTLLAASDNENVFFHKQAQHHADEKKLETRTKQKQGEEESEDFDEDDSFMKKDVGFVWKVR